MGIKFLIKLLNGLKNKSSSHLLIPAFFFVTAMLSACTTMQAYQGAHLPRSEVALVTGIDEYLVFGYKTVRIDSIDGAKTTGRGHSVEMLPGWHTLGVTYSSGALTTTYTGKGVCYIALNAKAGGDYVINGEIKGDIWHAWLEDTANGDKVNCEFKQPKAQPLENPSQ